MNEENLENKVVRLEQKVAQLEFYINLLREFTVAPEAFVLWDFIMSEQLNEQQTDEMMKVFSKHVRVLRDLDEKQEEMTPYWNDLSNDLMTLFEQFKWRTDRESILRVVLRASKLPHMVALNRLVQYAQKSQNSKE
ncbi:hypothetical protein NLX71_25355 [Paenibacillus sp. MZ04-78.2]|uniref:hypothetical protein n=1 Tax=Paenibacillus sp. MZ04-78.2 TaxID=2962034 RepID=UPI0020B8ACF0|nr:hypothetical protein [Paenibacillus sp. MZ04-78.2]MCP3776576.1 hypothetical protein [Paenibacillus sp. MZ04-78.2]